MKGMMAPGRAAIDRLMEVAATDPIHVDLDTQTVTTPFQDRFRFDIDPFRKMCLLEGLEAIAVLNLDDVPALCVQQVLKARGQGRGMAVDRGQQGQAGRGRTPQGDRVLERAPRQHDQLFAQGPQHAPRGLVGRDLGLHKQGDAVAPGRHFADQVELARLAATGDGPGQIGQCPENAQRLHACTRICKPVSTGTRHWPLAALRRC